MKKAFTIVETLVAVTVLMIAISGPLTVSFRALDAAVSSRNQIIATFLAQDAVEYIKNVKDNNVADGNGNGWLDGIIDCKISSMCNVDTLKGNIVSNCTSFNDNNCRLYRKPTGEYFHGVPGPTDIVTPFIRTVYVDNTHGLDYDNITTDLVVDVVWSTGDNGYARTTVRTKMYNISK